MRRSSVAAVAVATALCGAAGVARAQTVSDVVRRYLEARGGLVKLHSVETLRLTGTLELPDVSAPFVLELKRPKKMRTEFTVEGRIGVRAYDGTTAWAQPPLPGEPARKMGPEDAAEARSQADVDLSPLVDAAAKGFTVELVGRDRLPGGEVFELLVKGSDGSIIRMYLDTKTHLVVRTEERRSVEGKPVDFVTDIGDYRSVGGLVFPFRIEVGPKGDPERRQRLDIQKIEVNPPLDDARFRMPARPPAATP
jgi:outer membrane lipoprotein-sorting protein